MSAHTDKRPEQMLAIAITAAGGPEVLQPVEVATPTPGPDEVLIKIAAAGVNRPDCLQRRGLYPPPAGASKLPGLEVAGIVVACGRAVVYPQKGDRICALLAGGGYAEYCIAPAVQCLPAPRGLSLLEAATLPETYFTVWANVFDRGELAPRQRLLVHGGASGIGTAAIQMAAALDATVYTTVGTDAKAQLCKKLGATRAINYKNEDFLEVLRTETSASGVDVILDIVGGAYLEQNIKLLKTGGKLVVIGLLGGAKGTLNLGLVLSKHLLITGSTLRPRPPKEKGAIAKKLLEKIWPLLEQGKIKPVLQNTYMLSEAAQAHELLERNEAAGKLALIVDSELAASITRK
jgi:putative PIG3 family NAD(P)H quinone oxidoreductase